MPHGRDLTLSPATTPFTRNQRVTFSRTNVYSWNTSTRPRPRRTAQKSLPTRWRLVASRTRFVIIDGLHHPYSLIHLSGCPRTPCRPSGPKAPGTVCWGPRGSSGVNVSPSPIVSFMLCMSCISRFTVYIQHASVSHQLASQKANKSVSITSLQ